jgi:hypothetical protein
MKILLIWFYKYMATINYNAMNDERDLYGTCGNVLASYLNPRIAKYEKRMLFWINKSKKLEKGSQP